MPSKKTRLRDVLKRLLVRESLKNIPFSIAHTDIHTHTHKHTHTNTKQRKDQDHTAFRLGRFPF